MMFSRFSWLLVLKVSECHKIMFFYLDVNCTIVECFCRNLSKTMFFSDPVTPFSTILNFSKKCLEYIDPSGNF